MSIAVDKRSSGRPNIDINARQLLIYHARVIFLAMAYDKVSTRSDRSKIRDKCGDDSLLL